MKLNINSWHAKLVKLIHGQLPESLCNYFWGLIFTIVLFPLLLPVLLTNRGTKIRTTLFDKILYSAFFYFLLFIVPAIIGDAIRGVKGPYIISELVGLGVLSVIAIIVILVIVIIIEIQNYLDRDNSIVRDNVISNYIKTRKNKYCPKIEWRDEKEERK